MGGFAVFASWDDRPHDHDIRAAMDLIPHRSDAGMRVAERPSAVLAEARSSGPSEWDIATLGPRTLVGDLRVWDTSRLRALTGDRPDIRTAILAAFERIGPRVLDLVDGDFAFAVWDDDERRLFVARDRFGLRPAFLQVTRDGIRVASEVKQLAATSDSLAVDDHAVAEHLTGRYTDPYRTMFTGIERIGPGEYVEASVTGVRRSRYWRPLPDAGPTPTPDTFVPGYRERLIESVRDRLGDDRAVGHLSGGLDSSTIAASASVLVRDGLDPQRYATVSILFPDTTADEGSWIDDLTAGFPFEHRSFEATVDTVDQHAEDMWTTDQPFVNRIRDLEMRTAEVARERSAPVVLTGVGGDDVVMDSLIARDLLAAGRVRSWKRRVDAIAAWHDADRRAVAVNTAAEAVPSWLRTIARSLARSAPPSPNPLVHDHVTAGVLRPADTARDGFPSLTQRLIAEQVVEPRRLRMNDAEEAKFARFGVAVSHPFYDRRILEWVVAARPDVWPADGRAKSVARAAFATELPASVVERRRKTIGDEWFARVVAAQRPVYEDRFPTVPEAAAGWVDPDRYAAALREDGSDRSIGVDQLWRVWTLFVWLEGLGRYSRTSDDSSRGR